jgi:hypothetical protein
MDLANDGTATNAANGDDGVPLSERLEACRSVHVIRQYLEASNDVTIAAGCLDTLIRVGCHLGSECDDVFHHPVLNAILQAIDVLRNHQKDVPSSARRLATQYIDTLHASPQSPDFQFRFLHKCVLSGVSLCLEQIPLNDTFSAIVFDTASIILSHCNYQLFHAFIPLTYPRCLNVLLFSMLHG